jgi:hypothetical protein
MPANRNQWRETYPEGDLPAWSCPWRCHGTLVREGKPFFDGETPDSRDAHGDDNWEPDLVVDHRALRPRWRKCHGSVVRYVTTSHMGLSQHGAQVEFDA